MRHQRKRLVDPDADHGLHLMSQLGVPTTNDVARDVDELRTFGTPRNAHRPRVSGSRGGNDALASLLQVLEHEGYIEDATTE